MKNIIKSTLLLLCGVCLFSACSDDRDSNPTLLQPTTFDLFAPAYAESIDLGTSTGIPFKWNQPEYGFPVAAEYQLQVSLTNTFTKALSEVDEDHVAEADYATIDEVYNGTSGTLSTAKLSRAINAFSGWTEETVPLFATVYVRAFADVTGAKTVYSNVVSVTVIPNLVVAPSYEPFIYEIGNESGWATTYPMALVDEENGLYLSYNYLNGGFKFKPQEGNSDWANDFGQDPNGEYGDLVVDGEEDCNKTDGSFTDNLKPAGFYQINVDMAQMKWEVVEVKSITMVGDFNGWNQADADMHMTFNTDEKCWEITYTFAADAQVKFAMNDDWSVSWGGANGDASAYDNLTEFGGANLSVAAGTYKVKLYLGTEGTHKVEFGK